MVKKKRKHRENLALDILSAAKKLFLENGYINTSMRKIAAEVGISPTTIYLYYKDKADVIHALHQEGFKILSEQFKTLENVEHPFERLKAMGRCYINFALDNPDFYDIMFIMREPLEHIEVHKTKGDDLSWKEGEEAFNSLVSVVSDCQEVGYFKGFDAFEMALLLWANMHGLCALKNNGHLDLLAQIVDEKTEVSNMIYNSFDLYVKMIQNV